jgi:hypothetical protein
MSEESKQRMSKSHSGKKLSDHHREAISRGQTGLKKPATSVALKGRKLPEEWCKAISYGQKKVEPLWCEECSKSWTPQNWPRHAIKYLEGGKW